MSSNERMDVTEGMGTLSNEERMAKQIVVARAKAEFYKKHPLRRSSLSVLEECLLELLDPSTTPEMALESLSSPYFLSGAYSSDMLAIILECNQSIEVVIFLAYTRFIVTRLPEASVDGIWEDILFKILKYSQKFSGNEREVIEFASNRDSEIYRLNNFNKIIPTKGLRVDTWLNKALSAPSKCPNPYIRLELFRLIRQFNIFYTMTWECLSNTFMHTICEIQPHHLYPSGNIEDVLFCIKDMNDAMSNCYHRGNLQKIISTDLIKQLKEKNQVTDNSSETKFISNCIKIVGVFASIACCNPDRNLKYHELKDCCVVLRQYIGCLVDCGEYLPMMSIWMQFRYIITRPPFRYHLIETIRNLTKAIINHTWGYAKPMLINLRDMITEDLSVFHMTYTLPGLLLSRQVEGPTLVHQHSLLLKSLSRMYEKNSNEDSEFDDNPTSDTIPLSGDFDRWSLVRRYLPLHDCDSSDSNDNSGDSFLSSSDDSSNESAQFLESSNSDSFNDDSSDNMNY